MLMTPIRQMSAPVTSCMIPKLALTNAPVHAAICSTRSRRAKFSA
jgi:hypothetical protein